MINTKDQEQLFELISNYLEKDLSCVAIGGTAMMFMGYKTTTKDIDLVFQSEEDRKEFISSIEKLGYKKKSALQIYTKKKGVPLMYSRGEERFDLFVKDVFGFVVPTDIDKIKQRHDFIGKKDFIISILPFEYIILLKSITGREKDFEDIETIIEIEKNIDWEKIISIAIVQHKNNEWILIDLEETMQKLKKITFIPEKCFKMIYEAQDKI